MKCILLIGFLLSNLLFLSPAYGVTVQEKPAERIIALSPHSVELLFMLGVGHKIVATTNYSDYPEAAKKIPQIGGYNGVQIEKVLELDPDLIIAWEGGNKAQDIEQMERLGLNVYRSQTESLSDIAAEIIRLGALVGREAQAKTASKKFTDDLLKVRKNNEMKPKVTFFYQLWKDPLRAMAAGSWINEVITSCGGQNVFNDNAMDYPQVSMENVIQHSPEAIVIPSHHGTGVGEGGQWSDWPEIPAVKNGHIFYIDGDLLHRFSVRILEGVSLVCDAFDRVRADKFLTN